MFNMLLHVTEIFEKMDKNREKKAGIKKIQSVKCLFFSPSNYIFHGVFTMAETCDAQTCKGQRLTCVVQSTKKFHWRKYLFV